LNVGLLLKVFLGRATGQCESKEQNAASAYGE
jgi:hypothetical protein